MNFNGLFVFFFILFFNRFYNLTIEATNLASVSARTFVVVHILDQNDNVPYFLQKSYVGEISEAAEIGSLVYEAKNLTEETSNIINGLKKAQSSSGWVEFSL